MYLELKLSILSDFLNSPIVIIIIKSFLIFLIGTLRAASKLVKELGGNVVQGLVLMEKCELGGRKLLDFPVISLISE